MSIISEAPDGQPRRRGRPAGGGNTPEQARQALIDAAELCFAEQGLEVTVAEVARRAGVTRAVLYRHFGGRDELLVAVAAQVMDRYVAQVIEDLMPTDDVSGLITESLVFVATVVSRDPLLTILASGVEHGLASLIANSPVLSAKVSGLYEQVFVLFQGDLRPGLRPGDVGRYILSVALALLMDVIPGSDDAATVRRYVRTFVLPAIVLVPPEATPVF
ncbi:TetR/AcrR family transcriptional regulator [Mycobacterium sp. CVI_P3]|uniref:TetR/AcrR family transcriptional regulator n=1 Tax=Mycobacterium pinniadriaticum TaxID=2994102 RepID=A0ABT3SEU0_9MYCO|nr:TetR/AcrR family transcriptional regulator [Mycobacterium pinniadriaticum]MCX2930963.1 TetR/AcrR family transcriptional regulator [Mycobacterium pinniadriaticum]MCX2937387.1 TetR/AcrR family transcriptional regulator [Mycobacterium pinniadriaticum]